jgi:hypothetical protein
MESTPETGNLAPDLYVIALQHARDGLSLIARDALERGDLDTAQSALIATGEGVSRDELIALGNRARASKDYEMAFDAYSAADDSASLIALGDLLVVEARPLLPRDAWVKATRLNRATVLVLAVCVTAIICVAFRYPELTSIHSSVDRVVTFTILVLATIVIGGYGLTHGAGPDYRVTLRNALAAFEAAGAVDRMVRVAALLRVLGYEHEALDAYAKAVTCAEHP